MRVKSRTFEGYFRNQGGSDACLVALGVKYRKASLRVKMAEKIPSWLERVLLPQVNQLKGEIAAANARIDGQMGEVKGELKAMNARMGSLEGKLEGEFMAVRSDIERVEEKLGTKIDELEKRMDVTQRLAVVEEQVKELLARN